DRVLTPPPSPSRSKVCCSARCRPFAPALLRWCDGAGRLDNLPLIPRAEPAGTVHHAGSAGSGCPRAEPRQAVEQPCGCARGRTLPGAGRCRGPDAVGAGPFPVVRGRSQDGRVWNTVLVAARPGGNVRIARSMMSMQHRTPARLGRPLSVIGQGCWQIGADWGEVTDESARAVLDAALAAGVTFFDTADGYGDGRSEQLLGAMRARLDTDGAGGGAVGGGT